MKTALRRSLGRDPFGAACFLAPNLLGFLVFTLAPVAASFALSFMEWTAVYEQPRFVGLRNYASFLTDPEFWGFFYNTVFLMLGIPLGMAASLALALVMNQKIRGMVVYRAVYFLPTICAGVGLMLLWVWIYDPQFGLLNTLLRSIGVRGPMWLQSTLWAKPALILMGVWNGMGGPNMIIYLAALQGIDSGLYEAAEIDGAGAWARFWNVTWPLLSPATFFVFVMSTIGGFQGGFQQAYVMTGGGPDGTTTTLAFLIYNKAYRFWRVGEGAAIAWFLFLLVFAVTMINWRFGGRVVHYE